MPNILRWIQDCFDVRDFFQPFKGQYKGESFNSALPPCRIFPNAISCKPFAQFISETIVDRLSSGAISLWGKVGNNPHPYLVMPLTIEPSKCRLCNDNRFLNLWTRDVPFKLDSPAGLPRFSLLCSSLFGMISRVMIKSSSLRKAARILILNGVAGILPVTPFLLGGKHLPTFITLSVSLPLIIFVPSVYLVPYILMIVIRGNPVVSFGPLLRLPLVGPGQIFSSCQFGYFSGLSYSY